MELTIAKIQQALDALQFRNSTLSAYETEGIIGQAVKLGYIRRFSQTQAEWVSDEVIETLRYAEAVEKLKQDWLKYPFYDLFECEGFESSKEELKLFQKEWEQIWRDRDEAEFQHRLTKSGITDPSTLRYLERLEARIETLTDYINNLHT